MNELRKKRESHGFTLKEVAEAIGVSANAVSEWELGKSMPKPKHRLKLEKLFCCQIFDLFPNSGFQSQLPYYDQKLLNGPSDYREWKKKAAPENAELKSSRLDELDEKLFEMRFLVQTVKQLIVNNYQILRFMEETSSVFSDIEKSKNHKDAIRCIRDTRRVYSSKYYAMEDEMRKLQKSLRFETIL